MKEHLLNQLNILLAEKIDFLHKAINQTIESRDLQTKSTAGDKHETSRAIIQTEIDNLSLQLKKNKALKYELTKIDLSKKHSTVDFGALIDTNNGTYFIAIGWGRITVSNNEIYVVSLASPIGKHLHQKQIDDQFEFQGKMYIINSII